MAQIDFGIALWSQVAPWQGIAAEDFDGDGRADLYVAQNSFAPAPLVGRFDGGLELHRGSRCDLRRPVYDETEGAFGRVLAEQDDRPRKVRIDQLRHREQERRRERHRSILLLNRVRARCGVRRAACGGPLECVGNIRIRAALVRSECVARLSPLRLLEMR